MEVSPGPGPLRPEGCTRGEGRRRRRVPSGTRTIISLTSPLSFLSLTTALSPSPNCHITRRFPTDQSAAPTQGGAPLPEEETSATRTSTLAAICSAFFIGISSSPATLSSSSVGRMATQEEWEDLKKEVAMLKNMQRTQEQVNRAKKQEWEAEKQALEAEKRKLEYEIYDLLQVNFAMNDKLKRIRATCDE
ncbi:hypothetical protein QYE76_061335 [Lolium multiflorum]|uniref:Uncharacterized protein n=1 Tax=Lolium multiflorum TaxID=4521 RepID=A0AAD8S2Z5_LOLMU|nr:hypothetical protein QYE76_061335 [Lolium multiflorum]